MTIPAWQLITWKPVRATLSEFRRSLVDMRPLCEPAAGGELPRQGPRQGQTLWAAGFRGRPLGLAWDWAEVRKGVVALCDPMSVLSNLQLVDDEGHLLDEADRIVHLNSAVHDLDWQAQIVRQREGWLQPLAA